MHSVIATAIVMTMFIQSFIRFNNNYQYLGSISSRFSFRISKTLKKHLKYCMHNVVSSRFTYFFRRVPRRTVAESSNKTQSGSSAVLLSASNPPANSTPVLMDFAEAVGAPSLSQSLASSSSSSNQNSQFLLARYVMELILYYVNIEYISFVVFMTFKKS